MGESPAGLMQGLHCVALGQRAKTGLSYSPQDRNVYFKASLPNQDSLRMWLCLGCVEPAEVILSR